MGVIDGESMLYKYRGLSNLQFALDIFVNRRLHAARYKNLNDPMEGQYEYIRGTLDHWQREEIFGAKNEYRLVALSETHNNVLMWSYYAESHTGMVIGVEITQPDAQTVPIDYVENLNVDLNHHDVAQRVLSKKLQLWRHERERRVFVRRPFVTVDVHELYFGVGTARPLKELITSIANNFCPGIQISTLTKDDLDYSGAAHC
ncbi:MAG: hypothetical protein WCB68_20350 [Pyrinomonadaceae bacterium]